MYSENNNMIHKMNAWWDLKKSFPFKQCKTL